MGSPNYSDIYTSPQTFSTAAVEDADGLKTAAATSSSPQAFDGTPAVPNDWNGAAAAKFLAGQTPARTVSVTTSANVGTYRTGASYPIVVTGTRDGVEVTESLLLTDADGGETIRGDQPFDSGHNLSVAIPGQVDAGGTFAFGVQDICADHNSMFRVVKSNGTGTIFAQYQKVDAIAAPVTDAIPVTIGAKEVIGAVRVKSTDGVSSTDVGVTVYY